jgi:hypothetical protein
MHDATLRACHWQVRAFAVGVCLLLMCPSSSLAGVDVCQQPSDYSHMSVAYYKHEDSAVAGGTARARQERYDFDLQFGLNENWQLGIAHRYVILDVDPIDLQTNGHLHTLFFPVHRLGGSDSSSFRFSIAPSLSASSNVMKDPAAYSTDTFHLLAAVVWSRKLSEQATLRYGVCGDNSFGRYEIYPSIGIDWRPHADLTVELGFPTTRLTYQAQPNINLSLRISPDGNEWHVESRDMERQSQLISQATLLELEINWQARKRLTIIASIGRLFNNRYDVTLVDDTRVRLSHDPVTRIGAGLEWRF